MAMQIGSGRAGADTGIPLLVALGMLVLGILIFMATRGRLGYDQYRQDTALPRSETDL